MEQEKQKRTGTKRSKNQQVAYEAGRADERRRWARNLRRFLTTVPEDSKGIVMGLVFTSAILERICELAKTLKKTK